MAKIIPSSLIADAHGKLGGIFIQHSAQGLILKTLPRRPNPMRSVSTPTPPPWNAPRPKGTGDDMKLALRYGRYLKRAAYEYQRHILAKEKLVFARNVTEVCARVNGGYVWKETGEWFSSEEEMFNRYKIITPTLASQIVEWYALLCSRAALTPVLMSAGVPLITGAAVGYAFMELEPIGIRGIMYALRFDKFANSIRFLWGSNPEAPAPSTSGAKDAPAQKLPDSTYLLAWYKTTASASSYWSGHSWRGPFNLGHGLGPALDITPPAPYTNAICHRGCKIGITLATFDAVSGGVSWNGTGFVGIP